MSKQVIAIHNHTDQFIWTSSAEGYAKLPFQKIAGRGRHAISFPMADCSDFDKYWSGHHIQFNVMNQYSNLLQSLPFWNDDHNDYKIMQSGYTGEEQPRIDVPSTLKSRIRAMKGGHKGGNNAKVALHLFADPSRPGTYDLRAVVLTEAEERKVLAGQFREAVATLGLKAREKQSPEAIRAQLGQPAFASLKERAQEGGYKSMALVWGGGGSVGVGADVMYGVLQDMSTPALYNLKSTALTIGAEEGVVSFVGLYLSTEHAAEVGGLEFFEELGVDLGVGMALRVFTTFSGEGGVVILLTDGEELELSVGLGETRTTPLV